MNDFDYRVFIMAYDFVILNRYYLIYPLIHANYKRPH